MIVPPELKILVEAKIKTIQEKGEIIAITLGDGRLRMHDPSNTVGDAYVTAPINGVSKLISVAAYERGSRDSYIPDLVLSRYDGTLSTLLRKSAEGDRSVYKIKLARVQ